ncbi:anti-sigma-D factor RsdA [Williamsia sp.]|uniref:anti-sigma-D factor RsdA n=1 Tax=Williamsia sp. TaxID=1872085 RepID=UPI002F954AC3
MSRKRDRRVGGVDKGFGVTPSPDDAAVDEDLIPVDLGEVRADDEYIEALLSRPVVPTRSRVDYELAGLLSNWRSEVLSEPIGPNPTLEAVEAGIAAAARRSDTHRRSLRIARYAGGAVAAVALVFGGVSVVAHNAAPGDPLWGVKEVMFGADASSTLAMADAEANIERAAAAFAAGDKQAADKYLSSAESLLGDVNSASDRAALQRKIDKLRGLLEDQTTTPSSSESTSSSPVAVPPSIVTTPPSVTVTVPQETVTVTPTETVVSEPVPSSSEPPPTSVSEPPPSESTTTTTTTSDVPVVPPG